MPYRSNTDLPAAVISHLPGPRRIFIARRSTTLMTPMPEMYGRKRRRTGSPGPRSSGLTSKSATTGLASLAHAIGQPVDLDQRGFRVSKPGIKRREESGHWSAADAVAQFPARPPIATVTSAMLRFRAIYSKI